MSVTQITDDMILAIKDNDFHKLKHFTDETLRNALDTRKQNLLFYAIRQKAYDVLIYLIEAGCDLEQKNHYKDSPLHIAAYLGDSFMVKLLIQRNADINARNKKQETPLMQAALKGDLDTVKTLCSKGADLYAKDNEGHTVIMHAIKSKKLKVVNYLVDAKAPLHLLNDKKESVMHIAASFGLPSIVERLIELGVNPFQKNIYDQTPLHYAMHEEMDVLIDQLLALGLSSYDKDRFGQSPYDKAQASEYFDAVIKFTRHKNNPVIQKNDKTNPLHRAIRLAEYDEALAYLHKMADLNQKDMFGNTPLFYAIMANELMLVDLLIQKGAKCIDIDRNHKDVMFYAVINQNYPLIEMIKKYKKEMLLSTETERLVHQLKDEQLLTYL